MTVSESLLQIAELTKQNLQILQVINDSFFTKSNHLSTVVGETTYVIPSYIALENKVNHLQDAFNNLVHAAKSGETWFNFDGNSKEVLVRGYQSAPNPVQLVPTNKFETEAKTLFKDMLTPCPYLNFDMTMLPDDINQVKVKKIIPYASDLINRILAQCSSLRDTDGTAKLSWGDMCLIMSSGEKDYIPGEDYLEYETVYDLPTRHCTRSGSYIIEEVLTDQITENLENLITVRISDKTPLERIDFDGVTKSNLEAGDYLITYDGSAKLRIRSMQPAARTLVLEVMSGEYLNPIAAGKITGDSDPFKQVSDYSVLRLFSSSEDNRKLHIPLEEDQFVFIAVAPINPRLNTQSEWGNGLMVNADNLKLNDNDKVGFRSYYNENVLNIGDSMIELATITYPSITKYSTDEMETMLAAPVLDASTLQVVQINKHLNDSDVVKNIRALYSQKKQYQADLNEVQARITSLTEQLAEISFDDMSGTRSAYTAQIADLKDQQNNLTTSIAKIVDSIALAANNSELPIDGAKFRVRGYLDVSKFTENVAKTLLAKKDLGDTIDKVEYLRKIRENILGIEVRYRYRNPDIPQANVAVIGESSFLFTEWAEYNPPLRERRMEYKDGAYSITRNDIENAMSGDFRYSVNEPKFNQIDIPISQGELVEIEARIIWGFGYPFVKTTTEWSNTYTQAFPPELVEDVQVTTIIEENNNDIETNRFETILHTKGVTKHVDDGIDDQDVHFMHKPESVSSGFYTPERRIIPLKDKLLEMHGDIIELQDMIQGTTSEALSVMCTVDNIAHEIAPDIDNVIQLPAFSSIKDSEEKIPTGSAFKYGAVVYCPTTITLSNKTAHTVHLFSMFPGARTVWLYDATYHRFEKKDFVANLNNKDPEKVSYNGPDIVNTAKRTKNEETKVISYPQRMNQIITYRATNPYDSSPLGMPGEPYLEKGFFEKNIVDDQGNIIIARGSDGLWQKEASEDQFPKTFAHVFPQCPSEYGMCLTSDATNARLSLAPGESVSFQLWVEYYVTSKDDNAKNTKSQEEFTIGFNVRNSLYTEPLYYQLRFIAKYNQTTGDRLSAAKTNIDTLTKYNVTVR